MDQSIQSIKFIALSLSHKNLVLKEYVKKNFSDDGDKNYCQKVDCMNQLCKEHGYHLDLKIIDPFITRLDKLPLVRHNIIIPTECQLCGESYQFICFRCQCDMHDYFVDASLEDDETNFAEYVIKQFSVIEQIRIKYITVFLCAYRNMTIFSFIPIEILSIIMNYMMA